jgi:hypothetical protein
MPAALGVAHGKRDFHPQPAFRRVAQPDLAAMHGRHLLDDGQAQAAAGNVGAGQALETLEHPVPLASRNAGPGVANRQDGFSRGRAQFHVDASARRGIAQGVVEQVAQHHAQAFGLAHQFQGLARAHAQVDAADIGLGGEVRDRSLDEDIHLHRREGDLARFRLQARHAEQLVHQVGGPVHALAKLGQGGVALRPGFGPARDLGLQLDGGERRAQFVGRVGDEAALVRHGLIETRQQVAQGVHQGGHLIGHAPAVQGVQAQHAALHDFTPDLLEGRERPRDGGTDEEAQHHHQDARGGSAARGRFARTCAPGWPRWWRPGWSARLPSGNRRAIRCFPIR